MKRYCIAILISILPFAYIQAQQGTLQIYCSEGATVYLNGKYLGKTNTDMHGFLAENISVGEAKVSVYKNGFESQDKTVVIKENEVTEISFELVKVSTKLEKQLGMDLHFGAFGLFNVNNVFTKADYSFGATPYFDLKLHRNFAIGAEVMVMWGKPTTNDHPRMIICPNLRLQLIFSPFKKVDFHILVAGGFTIWPSRPDAPTLTPSFNALRMGWDIRAVAGASFRLSPRFDLNLNVGYWAASSTSDNIVWITHDTMLISMGPKFRF